ncbi:unnamed protein product, partial [Staurois parvus]
AGHGSSYTADHGRSRRCRLGHVISCVQSQLITWDIYTDHQSTDDQCALMISVAPEVTPFQCPSVPAVSAHQCLVPVPISATSMAQISAYQCTSMPHISAHLSCLSVPRISAAHQCPSVMPVNAHQCNLPVPPHQ